jgi:hypothetical protein
MHRGDRGEGFFDHPVDLDSRNRARRIARGRAMMDHIAERGSLDEEDARHGGRFALQR